MIQFSISLRTDENMMNDRKKDTTNKKMKCHPQTRRMAKFIKTGKKEGQQNKIKISQEFYIIWPFPMKFNAAI